MHSFCTSIFIATAMSIGSSADVRADDASLPFYPVDGLNFWTVAPSGVPYPIESKLANEEGNVQLRFFVRRDGTIVRHEIAKSSGRRTLDEAAMDATAHPKKLPPLGDEASPGAELFQFLFPVNFHLEGDGN